MVTAVVANAIMQFLYMMTVLFTIGDVSVVLADPLPILQVYYQATGSKAATNFFVAMLAVLGTVAFFNCFASPTSIPWGPFRLGQAGPLINIFSLCYIVFMLIWMPFPAYLPVDSVNMNYAGPITGAIILAALLDWCIGGRKRFQVPVARLMTDGDD